MIILIVIFYLFSKFLFFGHAAILAAFFVFSLVNLLTGTAAIRVTFFWIMGYGILGSMCHFTVKHQAT